jgi:hypothetical protein
VGLDGVAYASLMLVAGAARRLDVVEGLLADMDMDALLPNQVLNPFPPLPFVLHLCKHGRPLPPPALHFFCPSLLKHFQGWARPQKRVGGLAFPMGPRNLREGGRIFPVRLDLSEKACWQLSFHHQVGNVP